MKETSQIRSSPAARGPDRDTVAVLERIDQRLARVEAALERAEALERAVPAAIATATDTFDDAVDHLRAKGVDVDERLRVVLDAVERLTSPDALKALSTLLDKLALASTEAPRELGLWGAARAMSDDDVKRAVGFVFRVAQLFGRSLDGRDEHDGAPRPRLSAEGAAQ